MFEIPGPTFKKEEKKMEEVQEIYKKRIEEKEEEKPKKKLKKAAKKQRVIMLNDVNLLKKIKNEIKMFRQIETTFEDELSSDVVKKLDQVNKEINFYSKEKRHLDNKLKDLIAVKNELTKRKAKIMKETSEIKEKINVLERSFRKIA